MRLIGQILLVAIVSLLFMPVLLWIVVTFWQAFPPNNELVLQNAAAMQRLWSNMGAASIPHQVELFSEILAAAWPLWITTLASVLAAIILLLIMRLQQQAGPFIKRVHQLEGQLSQSQRELRQTREQLTSYNTKLVASYANSQSGLIELAPSGQIVQLNKTAMRLLHKWSGTNEPLEQKVLQLVIPDYAESALATAVHSALAEGNAWEGELTLPSVQAHNHCRVFPSVGGVFITLRDISHRYVDDETINTDQAALQALLDKAPLPLAVLDQDWCYLKVSHAWGEQFNLAADHLNGQRHFEVMPDFPRNRQTLEHLLTEKAAYGEEPLKYQQQEDWYRWQVTPWQDKATSRNGYILTAEVITEQAQTKNRLASQLQTEHKLAYHDILTGLPNRQLFYDRLNLGLAQAYRQLSRVALLFLDLDGFKAVNDTYGHDAGDLLLKEVSERLKQCVRKTDTVARLGGDEFTIILAAVRHADDVAHVADKVVEQVNLPYDIMNQQLRVGTSIGIAMYPDDGASAGDLITLADEAMYDAKNSGKNQYRFISELKAAEGHAEAQPIDPAERREQIDAGVADKESAKKSDKK